MLVTLLGVSGSGKNAIIDKIVEKWDIRLMPTATTRPMRDNEFKMSPNRFISKRKFFKEKKRGKYLESLEVHKGIFYATERSILENESKKGILIKDLDVHGTLELKKQGYDLVTIFIVPPTKEILAERLRKRGESEESIKKRLSRWDYETGFIPQMDYLVTNDVLSTAVKEVEEIIAHEAEKRKMKFEENNRRDFFVVYNRLAGRGNSVNCARKICEKLAEEFDVRLVCSKSPEQIKEFFKANLKGNASETVVVVGGDGTLGSCVDGITKSGFAPSIAVFPCGTANDFSKTIGITKNINKFVQLLKANDPQRTDIAKVNGFYAVHAVGVGNFTHGGTAYSAWAKKHFGVLGYWVKCFFSAFRMRSQKLQVEVDGEKFEEDFLFAYVVNSKVAGGFSKFAPDAKIYDGAFEFVGIKKCNIFRFSWIVLKILFGKHIHSKQVIYKKGKHFKISRIEKKNHKFSGSDLDGNIGPELPLVIDVLNKNIEVFCEKID